MTKIPGDISKSLPGAIKEIIEFRGETTVLVDPEMARKVLEYLKEKEDFNYLVDISSAHWPDDSRIDVVWQVRNLSTKDQLRVKAGLVESNPSIESVVDLWPTADWLEREVYDLMGVVFLGHPELHRIMMPEDFEGFPLRKEYPMEGYAEWRNYLPVEGDKDEH